MKKILLFGEELTWGPDDVLDYLSQYGDAEHVAYEAPDGDYVRLGDFGLRVVVSGQVNEVYWLVGVFTQTGLLQTARHDVGEAVLAYLSLKGRAVAG